MATKTKSKTKSKTKAKAAVAPASAPVALATLPDNGVITADGDYDVKVRHGQRVVISAGQTAAGDQVDLGGATIAAKHEIGGGFAAYTMPDGSPVALTAPGAIGVRCAGNTLRLTVSGYTVELIVSVFPYLE